MRHWSCGCGAAQAFGSMGPPTCSRCAACGTSLYCGTDGERLPPEPHEYILQPVDTDEGIKTLSRCRHCFRTRAAIEAEAARG